MFNKIKRQIKYIKQMRQYKKKQNVVVVRKNEATYDVSGHCTLIQFERYFNTLHKCI